MMKKKLQTIIKMIFTVVRISNIRYEVKIIIRSVRVMLNNDNFRERDVFNIGLILFF